MEFMSDAYNKVTNYLFPNADEGYTAIIKECKDEIGRITSVGIDILPTVVWFCVGPYASAVTATVGRGSKTAKALYDYLTTPTSSEKIKALPSSEESQGVAKAGAMLLSTVLHLVREAGVVSTNSRIEALGKEKQLLHIAEESLRGRSEALIHAIAQEALEKIIPEVAIQIFRIGADPLKTVLKWNVLRENINELMSAISSIKYKHELIKSTKAAIDLTKQVAALERGKRAPKERVISTAKTIAALKKFETEQKAKGGPKKITLPKLGKKGRGRKVKT